jgi:hypothetical protein
MAESFDPYRKWLGIAPEDQPPNHYRLLGISLFESDPDVIDNAATRQMTHVRAFQASKHAALSQRILKELTIAKLCLLTPERKEAYDHQIRTRLAVEGKAPVDALLPQSAPPAEPPRAPLPPFPRQTEIRYRLGESPCEKPTDSAPPAAFDIPVPESASTEVPVVRPKPAAYLRARRKRNVLPTMLIIGSLVVLIVGGTLAGLMLSGYSLGRALELQPSPQPSPAAPRTE